MKLYNTCCCVERDGAQTVTDAPIRFEPYVVEPDAPGLPPVEPLRPPTELPVTKYYMPLDVPEPLPVPAEEKAEKVAEPVPVAENDGRAAQETLHTEPAPQQGASEESQRDASVSPAEETAEATVAGPAGAEKAGELVEPGVSTAAETVPSAASTNVAAEAVATRSDEAALKESEKPAATRVQVDQFEVSLHKTDRMPRVGLEIRFETGRLRITNVKDTGLAHEYNVVAATDGRPLLQRNQTIVKVNDVSAREDGAVENMMQEIGRANTLTFLVVTD
eukprot:TRINITY_DN8517_c0_g1_i3.p1 TRINITY_DN8517_c0_g1~~TRINITY_DN8517_c0_g1_i3.p1  ORF type:complete len:322 (-),score=25.44 TRINITY_DN8517_c0_g1_i3:200-1030(-)